jgi:hypothetical protein
MKRIIGTSFYAAILSALAFAFVASDPGTASAKALTCPPDIMGQTMTQKIIVPTYTSCKIEFSEVLRTVEVGTGSALIVEFSKVYGNIELAAGTQLDVAESELFGNIECEPGAIVEFGSNTIFHRNIDEDCMVIEA